MAGKTGFFHRCESKKVNINKYKKAIRDSSFSTDQIDIIWDFYVTHSFASSTELSFRLEDYGWDLAKSKRDKTLENIEIDLMHSAKISKLCCIRSRTIKDTLRALDLSGDTICIEHPRIVLQQEYSISIDENEKIKFAGGGENRINCLFRHIRNSLAHGNTYFFENGNLLLQDKKNSSTTAAILIREETLLEWIKIIYKNNLIRLRNVNIERREDKELVGIT